MREKLINADFLISVNHEYQRHQRSIIMFHYPTSLIDMAKIFAKQEVGYADPVIFTTPGRYSMDAAIEILKRLENDEDYKTENSSMKSLIDGDLVEIGIPVKLGNIEFSIMCSYEDIFIKRISGNKMKFYEFCESIRDMDFSPRS